MITAAQIQAKAYAAVQKVGSTGTFTVSSGGVYDPSTGNLANVTKGTFTAKVSPPVSWRVFYKQGTQGKEASSVIVLPVPVAGLSFKPVVGTKVVLAGVQWQVNAIRASVFQDTTVAYELEVTNG